ncbi:TolC family protein [Kiritimatiellota bacterium B12222]|nr:TolC family protein [Kiritimatiellota bacterium B12222]
MKLLLFPCFLSCFTLSFLSAQEELPVRELTLQEAQQIVLLNNFEIASRRLGMESALRLFEGEKGAIWEPSFVGGIDRVSNDRENNTEEYIAQGVDDFSEENTLSRASIEQPLPTGGAIQLTYTLDKLDNNLQETRDVDFVDKEYESFAGITFLQPLLKNGGLNMGYSLMRMAREESEIAFQEYRRQLMQSLGQAEAAYWELRIAQERVLLREKSVEVAESILADNRARVENGKMSELEVQEAAAGVASRESLLLEARQNLQETSSRLLGMFGMPDIDPMTPLRAVDSPKLLELPEIDIKKLSEQTLMYHPDVLIREHRINQDELRVVYAKNQVLPQLDLRASYGYNGLGDSPSDAFSSIDAGDFPSWTVGLEVRVPLGGGQRQRAERDAAMNRLAQGHLGEEAVRQQILQGLNTSVSRVKNYFWQAKNFQQVSEMNEAILESELARLEAGRSDSRKVLDAEEKVTQAREAQAASLTRLAVAKIEMDLSSGTLLMNMNVDPMLENQTIQTLVEDVVEDPAPKVKANENLTEDRVESLLDDLQFESQQSNPIPEVEVNDQVEAEVVVEEVVPSEDEAVTVDQVESLLDQLNLVEPIESVTIEDEGAE